MDKSVKYVVCWAVKERRRKGSREREQECACAVSSFFPPSPPLSSPHPSLYHLPTLHLSSLTLLVTGISVLMEKLGNFGDGIFGAR